MFENPKRKSFNLWSLTLILGFVGWFLYWNQTHSIDSEGVVLYSRSEEVVIGNLTGMESVTFIIKDRAGRIYHIRKKQLADEYFQMFKPGTLIRFNGLLGAKCAEYSDYPFWPNVVDLRWADIKPSGPSQEKTKAINLSVI